MSVSVLTACMSWYHVCDGCLSSPEEGVRSAGTGATDS